MVFSYICQQERAAAAFEAGKLIYEATAGRSQPKDRNVIMYRILQSFKPGEATPEVANQIGYELAIEYTKGNINLRSIPMKIKPISIISC